MIVLLIALFCLFFLITIRDVRYRLVYGEDLLMLVSLRILAAALSLYPDESGLQAYQWGFASLGVSALVACFVAALFWALGQLVSKVSSSAALGWGDVLLLAACCLFVGAGNFVCCIDGYCSCFGLAVCEEEQNLPLCPGIGVALLASACSVGMG